jgi:hypothetical protein
MLESQMSGIALDSLSQPFQDTITVCVCVCVCLYLTSGGARAHDTCPKEPRGL